MAVLTSAPIVRLPDPLIATSALSITPVRMSMLPEPEIRPYRQPFNSSAVRLPLPEILSSAFSNRTVSIDVEPLICAFKHLIGTWEKISPEPDPLTQRLYRLLHLTSMYPKSSSSRGGPYTVHINVNIAFAIRGFNV